MPTTESDYITTAKTIEKEFGFPVSVIKRRSTSPIPMSTMGNGYTMFLVLPNTEDHEATEKTFIKIREKHPYIGITIAPSVNEFVAMARKNRQMIRYNTGGMGLISPFFFHEEVYGRYGREFRKAVNREFSKELHAALKGWMEKLGIKSVKDYKKRIQDLKRANEIEKKVVGPREQKYLQEQLARMATEIGAKDAQVLIIHDRAARYLAKPLQKILFEVFHKKPKLFFIDPDMARWTELEVANGATTLTRTPEQLRQIFEKEFPGLVKAIRGKRVVLVDDQTYTNHTRNGMIKLIEHYKPQALESTALSTVQSTPQPSWREQGLYAIQSQTGSFKVEKIKVNAKMKRQIRGLQSNLNRIANRTIQTLKRRH